MKAKAKVQLEHLKQQFERLRQDSAATVGAANERLYAGLQQFADKELKALTLYYKSALRSLKASKKRGASAKSVMQTQFDLLQETVVRLIGHARETLDAATQASAKPAAPARKRAAQKAAAKKAAAPKKAATKKVATKKRAARKAVAPATADTAIPDTGSAPGKAAV